MDLIEKLLGLCPEGDVVFLQVSGTGPDLVQDLWRSFAGSLNVVILDYGPDGKRLYAKNN